MREGVVEGHSLDGDEQRFVESEEVRIVAWRRRKEMKERNGELVRFMQLPFPLPALSRTRRKLSESTDLLGKTS